MSPERLAEIQARTDAATPGPWRWRGNTESRHLRLQTPHHSGLTVMDFVRWGMQGARPRFAVDHIMHTADEMVVYEVAAWSKDIYRKDAVGIEHPDAEFIAHARQDVADLLAEVGWLAAEHADRTADLETSAGVAEQAWKREAKLSATVLQLRAALDEEKAAHAKTVDAWESILGVAEGDSLAVWRAEHDGIPLGLYLAQAAAREHCRARWVDTVPDRADVFWVDAPPEFWAPADLCYRSEENNASVCTGYTVVPVPLLSAYDPDGEE
jgi:hypothetical protein